MQIIDNKALLLKVRNPGKITTVIPKSKALDDNQVLVHWNLEEAQVLKNLQIKNVPSPILGRYDWPGRYKPFDHQKTTASFLTLHRRAFCLSEQGTGKTGSVIWAADYLMSIGKIKRALIICPLSIMDSAWRADLFNFAMHRKVDIAHGSRDKRKAVINSDAEFVIINYDGVNIVEEDIKKAGFDLLIVDECFVEGTKVDTPSGYREIQTLAAGDEVFTSDGVKRIKRLVRNTSTTLVDVRLSNGQTITCTREHPFFTDVGWVTAENLIGRRLVSKDELSNMRDGISGKEGSISMAPEEWFGNRVDLLSILRSEEISHTESGGIVLQPHETRGTGEPVGGSAFGDLQAEHVEKTETDRPQACGAGRERNGYHTYGAIDKAGSTALLGMELPSSVGEEARRLSHELQARFCKSGIENRAGSGWEQPRHECKENPRSEEGSKIIGTWVESVTHKEQGRGTPVFNLEVEGTPNYYVGDGYLVHNCNAYKNCQTTRWKVLNRIITPDTWLWMMTGTPAAQSPVDAYGLAKLVNPNSVPQFFTSFKDMVMQKVSTFRWTIRPNADKIVYEALQPAIRFTKEECLDLPEMTYVTRIVELTPQQKKYYEALRNQLVVQAAGEQITAVNAAVGLNKLLQISSGAAYADNKETIQFDISNRYKVLREVIDETNQKILVFVPFKHTIEMLREKLIADGFSAEVINGEVSAGKRTEIFKRFQSQPDPRILIIQPQAAAHGVTLTAADTIVWWGPTSSLEIYAQANARAHRAGQRHPVTVVKLQGSNAEKHVYKMLEGRIDENDKLIDLYKNLLD